MKKILVVQSIPYVLRMVRERLLNTFPQLEGVMMFSDEFEEALEIVASKAREGELVVITSDSFHDEVNARFSDSEKNASRLALEIKQINPLAKVYAFSQYDPEPPDYLDGSFKKSQGGDGTLVDIIDIFIQLDFHRLKVDE